MTERDQGRPEGLREGGFSLIEVMAAMTLLTVGVLGIMALQVKGARQSALSASAATAAVLARMQMERIIDAEYDAPGIADINTSNNSMLDSLRNVDYQDVDLMGKRVHRGKYTLFWNTADNTPVKNTRTIVVTVSWNNQARSRRFVFIKSLVS